MLIGKLEELNQLIGSNIDQNYQCILSIEDNKSKIIIQHIVVKHPLDFIRNLNEFSKNTHLPVSDISIHLSGYISNELYIKPSDEIVEISPYVYFKKPDEVNVSVGSDDSVPPTES